MKKLLTLVLVGVMLLSVCACGDKKASVVGAVTSALNNTAWEISAGSVTTAYAFKDGEIAAATETQGMVFGEEQGKFTVTDAAIEITWDDPESGRVKKLYYSYDNNAVKLFADEAKSKEITKVK